MTPLFAVEEASEWGLLICSLACSAIPLVIGLLFLRTLQNALSRCDARSRLMSPGRVWLNVIPLFHLFWQFYTVSAVSRSLAGEFRHRRWRSRGGFGASDGLWACAAGVVSMVLVALDFLLDNAFFGQAGGMVLFGGTILGIVYWVKIARRSAELAADDGFEDDDEQWQSPRRDSDDEDDDDDDDDDDNRRRRRRKSR